MAAPFATGGRLVSAALEQIRELVRRVPDPEIPVLSLEDLGILRGVETSDDGHPIVKLTPTYSGCPAIDPIREEVTRVLCEAGHDDVEVRMVLAPAWTTDWMTDEGRVKLRDYGIAPPERIASNPPCVLLSRPARCPRCGSADTREVSRFGATPCQAQHACNACLEPFARFKAI
jgi:ring-1,2-phenylacetyl-CoA epoxidase subunit PaaD